MLLHNGFKMYNDLPCEVRGERSLKCFRRMMVQYIKGRERLGAARLHYGDLVPCFLCFYIFVFYDFVFFIVIESS